MGGTKNPANGTAMKNDVIAARQDNSSGADFRRFPSPVSKEQLLAGERVKAVAVSEPKGSLDAFSSKE
jgi:hypothetical protein